MSTEIYYFSGTGNSLHVAKELQKRIPDTSLIPMVSLINRDIIQTNGEAVGFVFPIHFMSVPMIVKSIIKKFELKSAKYIFAIATRAGYPCSSAFTKIEKILKNKGKRLDSYLILNMASNDPKFKDWHQATEEEIADFESEIQDRLNSFEKIIKNQVTFKEKDTQVLYPVNFVMEHLGGFFAELAKYSEEEFYADTKCSGCGTCETVCLSKKIKMANNRPVWQKHVKCFLCDACLNFCPVQSVQIRSGRFIKLYTKENGRYSHPEATVNDIAGQKNSSSNF